ncbi:hypothetical protein PSTG_14089 [Puccinia striiformis f. sp. tritici PST-78]|uniref:Uncharacterized protein n=1 Tax=Puccinia striiformis f. sp. tritici PST-78 TaxID=1165861 RepID=A0A0L0UZN6_9BASI|nr:hypothetical protein PSTG_14089 [Puccinia striiformis f. sp. tritici PST-78]
MLQRPSSSLGFNSGTSAGLAGLHSPVPVAELYSSLDPLSNVDQDLSIPPPPYELIDPTSPITYHNANTNTQSAPASSTNTNVVLAGAQRVISSHHHHRAPRGPRPLLNNRATSAFSTATTTAALFGSQHPPGSARTQPKSQSQTGGYHIQPVIKTRNKLAKYRPPPPNLIHRDKVNQVYQSPVYHPFSSTPNAPTSPTRPPLSNASRAQKLSAKTNGPPRSNRIKPGPPPMITTRNDHHRAPAVLAGEEPSRTGLPKANQVQSAPSGRSAGRSAVLLASPASAPPSRAGQSARFICPECRCKSFDQQLINLHIQTIHAPHLKINTFTNHDIYNHNMNYHFQNDQPSPPLLPRHKPLPSPHKPFLPSSHRPLPPSINRSLIRTPLCQSTRNINQTTYFT